MNISVFKNKNVARLLGGQALSQICDRMTSIGFTWILAERGGVHLIPWYLACAGIPHLLLVAISPKLINSIGTQKVLVFTDGGRALLYLVVSVLSFFGLVKIEPMTLFVLVVLTNIAAAIFNPAVMTVPMEIAEKEELQSVNGAMNSCFSSASVFGPLLAAILYGKFGIGPLLFLTALAYSVATYFNACLQIKKNDQPLTQEQQHTSVSIFSSFRTDALIQGMLFLFFSLNLFFAPIQVALPVYAKDLFHGNVQTLAELELALGIGMITGGTILAFVKFPGARIHQILVSLLLIILPFLGFSLMKDLLLSLAMLFLMGISVGIANVLIISEFQERPAPEFVPGIMSLVNLISVAAIPFSMMVTAILLKTISLYTLLPSCAFILLILLCASVPFLESRRRRTHEL